MADRDRSLQRGGRRDTYHIHAYFIQEGCSLCCMRLTLELRGLGTLSGYRRRGSLSTHSSARACMLRGSAAGRLRAARERDARLSSAAWAASSPPDMPRPSSHPPLGTSSTARAPPGPGRLASAPAPTIRGRASYASAPPMARLQHWDEGFLRSVAAAGAGAGAASGDEKLSRIRQQLDELQSTQRAEM